MNDQRVHEINLARTFAVYEDEGRNIANPEVRDAGLRAPVGQPQDGYPVDGPELASPTRAPDDVEVTGGSGDPTPRHAVWSNSNDDVDEA